MILWLDLVWLFWKRAHVERGMAMDKARSCRDFSAIKSVHRAGTS